MQVISSPYSAYFRFSSSTQESAPPPASQIKFGGIVDTLPCGIEGILPYGASLLVLVGVVSKNISAGRKQLTLSGQVAAHDAALFKRLEFRAGGKVLDVEKGDSTCEHERYAWIQVGGETIANSQKHLRKAVLQPSQLMLRVQTKGDQTLLELYRPDTPNKVVLAIGGSKEDLMLLRNNFLSHFRIQNPDALQ